LVAPASLLANWETDDEAAEFERRRQIPPPVIHIDAGEEVEITQLFKEWLDAENAYERMDTRTAAAEAMQDKACDLIRQFAFRPSRSWLGIALKARSSTRFADDMDYFICRKRKSMY
jgi:3'-phosphoadenosine 5'-phosphosulfate sulfotransferase (PAPS reductase)/FAD synthetase